MVVDQLQLIINMTKKYEYELQMPPILTSYVKLYIGYITFIYETFEECKLKKVRIIYIFSSYSNKYLWLNITTLFNKLGVIVFNFFNFIFIITIFLDYIQSYCVI